jgi:hypothetical protein
LTVGEYTAAFTSIILGLAVADLATSLQRLLRAGRLVVWDVLAPLAALLAGISVINMWWSLYPSLIALDRISIASFIPDLVSLLLMFLVAGAALPHEVPDKGIDLRDFYEGNRKAYWVPFSIYLLWAALGNAVFGVRNGSSATALAGLTLPNLVLAALMIVLAINSRRWVHVVGLAVLFLAVLSAWLPQEIAARM